MDCQRGPNQEARRLYEWLTVVKRGEIVRSPDNRPTLDFTEPCIALGLERMTDDVVVLRIYLSYEAEPAFVLTGAHGHLNNFLRLTLTREELGDATAEWEAEIHAYPAR
ncbi:WapI family immunity protein [Arthrobacter gyeryongensis]